MKNATIQDEEEIENEHTQIEISQQEIHNRADDDEQMAIIQFRNAEQSPLIVKIERDGYDNFETADDFLTNKPTPRTRQLQKARQKYDSSITKKEYLHNSNYDMKESYDDYMDDDHEYETGDTFVENIDDDDNIIDGDENLIFKYRSSTQKST